METQEDNSTPDPVVSRRSFLKMLAAAGAGTAVVGSGWLYVTQVEPAWFEITNVGLQLPHLPASFSGFRFLQLSDIHVGTWMNKKRLAGILDTVKEINPQLVVLTGDFVLGHGQRSSMQDVAVLEAALKTLTASFSCLAVLGNQDYWYDAPSVVALLQRAGVNVLVNTVQQIQIGHESLYFAGVDDVFEKRFNIHDILSALPAGACTVLMAHEPDFADLSAATGKFDLQISGHSHGGQVVLPFIGPPVLPTLGEKYPLGLYRVGSMYQYTNRGVGMTPPYVRFNCRPEITVFTLLAA